MAKDSRQWEEALIAMPPTKKIKVPNYKKQKPTKLYNPKPESMVLMHELRDNTQKIHNLRNRNREIKRLLKGQKLIKNNYFDKPIQLYALRLEDRCWYVGMSRNPERRFTKHGGNKGAMWTREHKPIEIIEIRQTGSTDDGAVNLLEDDMTLEYALKYGSEFVRGGGYCQRKPRWPDVVIQNEKVI